MVGAIPALIANLPTYDYRRVHALLRREATRTGRTPTNPRRVYQVIKVHRLLLQRHNDSRKERRHDGHVAVDPRNIRWCSDALETACGLGEKVRVAFALDCCDREAMEHIATTGGITAEDIRSNGGHCRASLWLGEPPGLTHRMAQRQRQPLRR